MSRLDARLSKLEAVVGEADGRRYWDAYMALEPQRQELYRACREGELHIADFMDDLLALEKTLPPCPSKRQRKASPAERDAAVAEMLSKLHQTRVRVLNGIFHYEEDEINPATDYSYLLYEDEPPRRGQS